MIIQITNDESVEEFKKNVDLSGLIIQVPIPYNPVDLDWNSIQSTLMYKMFDGGLIFGTSTFRVDYSFNYGILSNYPASIWFRYSNAIFSIKLDRHLSTTEVTMVARHLRKNKERKVKIVEIDGILYLALNWGELYSEVIRINNRVKGAEKKRNLRDVGYSLKLLALQGKLIEDGIDIFIEKDNYTGGRLRTLSLLDRCGELTLNFLKSDKCNNIEITEDTMLEFSDSFGTFECTYRYAVEYSRIYKEFSDKIKQIGPRNV